ncbi:MAG: hypothetical protein KAS11_00140 [Candidatus Aenigmarchaeota archaeon]|nr:hypothetical protein [Candidatus Aenigmarchaeota archaeon]MCK5289801.1 hypothetical protein [Candidatus Aenigmarchaeota archaeon]
MQSSRNTKKGELTIETVIIIVLFIAVLAVLLIIIMNITGKGTDQMGQNVDASGDGALCQIECLKCCSGNFHDDCNFYVGDCCIDNEPTKPGC